MILQLVPVAQKFAKPVEPHQELAKGYLEGT
jgi:hypothetical protein